MKKVSRSNGNKPVTHTDLEVELKKFLQPFQERMDKYLLEMDRRLDDRFGAMKQEMDRKFGIVDNKIRGLTDLMSIKIDHATGALETKIDKRHNEMLTMVDAFVKRSEANEREILFLGHQHDDLAKYCTDKIAYPIYGRK